MKDFFLDFYNPDIKAIILFIIIAVVVFFSFRKSREKKGSGLILGIRLLILLLFTFLYMKPVLKWKKEIRQKPLIEFWIDNSQSITKSKDYNKEAFVKKIETAIGFVNKESVDVKIKKFDSDIQELLKVSKLDFSGSSTDISNLLVDKENRIDAAILVSDGQVNAGENIFNMSGKTDFPIYTIGIGDTLKKVDARIVTIESPQKVKIDDNFKIFAEVNLPAKSGKTNIQLLKNDEIIVSKIINSKEDQFLQKVEFDVKAEDIGENEYSVQIENPSDKNLHNNKQSTLVNVLPGKKNILILCNAPSFETRGLMSIFQQSKDYDANVAFFNNNQLNIKIEKVYDLLILIGFPGKLNTPFEIEKARNLVDNNIPVIAYLNKNSNADKLNVIFDRKIITNYKIKSSSALIKEKTQNSGNPIIREIFDKISWDQLPPISYDFQQIQLNPNFNVLLETTELNPKPIMAVSKELSMVSLVGTDFWRWNMMTENRNYKQILLNSINYLLEDSDNSKVQITSQKKIFLVGEQAEFSGVVYDLLRNAIPEAEIKVSISKDSIVVDDFYMNWNKNEFTGHYTMQEQGEYSIDIEAKIDEHIIDKKSMKLKVLDRVLEFTETGQNKELLEFIAKESKGKVIDFDEIKSIISSINNKSQIFYEDRELDFYIHELIFTLLLFLLTFEWITRKYFGYL